LAMKGNSYAKNTLIPIGSQGKIWWQFGDLKIIGYVPLKTQKFAHIVA
jgi:hypothetical protein